MRDQRPHPRPGTGRGPQEPGPRGRKSESADVTHAETRFFARLVDHRLPVLLRLRDGEELRGVLEWYDRGSLRLGLPDGGHRIVSKRAIATLEESGTGAAGASD